MNTQRRMSTLIRITLSCLIAFVIVGLVVPPRPATAAADNCQCVGFVVNQLYGGTSKGIGEWGANPYKMSLKANYTLAKTNETSVYWAASPQPIHKPRTNAGWAKAGDVVIFQPGDTVFFKREGQNWYPTTIDSTTPVPTGHIGIVTEAIYYSSAPSEITDATTGGWMVKVKHANWDGCGPFEDRFFVPNGTKTSWWRES